MPLDPEIKGMLDALAAMNAPPMSHGTPAAARAAFRFLTVDLRSPENVVAVKETEDVVIPTDVGEMAARIYRPEHDVPVPTVVFAHGGGFVIGDIETHDNQARTICAGTDSVVVSIDYRLAPEAPWPAATEDALAALRWAADNVDELGGDPDRIAVAGDSAGGNVMAVVAQLARTGGPELCAQLLIYPSIDFDEDADYPSRVDNADGYFLTADDMLWFRDNYARGVDCSDPRLSPIRGDLAGLPPAVVVTAEFDPLRDEGEAYVAAMRAAGVPVDAKRYDGLVHGFFDLSALSRAAQAAVDDTVARFRALLWT